ncbi:MAG: DUF5615 family PIN-like protein [Candidatus Pacebacteria bacterium]|jgi:predicted nuclease of predicted toxin-antitoxin system|nr:DUF5615 family PIN-like protein [Candidatus Paceibacterota bacterium]
MIKIFADECVNKDIIEALKNDGCDVMSVFEAGLVGRDDDEIFHFAAERKRILLTFDRGFGDVFRFNIANSSGVVILLASQFSGREIIDTISKFFRIMETSGGLNKKLALIGKNKVRIISR